MRYPDHTTARQDQILDAIREITEQTGAAPSTSELAKRFGRTRVGIRRQLVALEDKGLVFDKPITIRSGRWQLTPKAEARAERLETLEPIEP